MGATEKWTKLLCRPGRSLSLGGLRVGWPWRLLRLILLLIILILILVINIIINVVIAIVILWGDGSAWRSHMLVRTGACLSRMSMCYFMHQSIFTQDQHKPSQDCSQSRTGLA